MKSTLPTGNEVPPRFKATPNKEPAQTMAYSGICSQKYFKLFNASLHSCTSSKIIRVRCGSIFCPQVHESICKIRLGSLVRAKSAFNSTCASKLTYMVLAKHNFPNWFNTQDLPTCLAPWSTSGLRYGLFCQALKSLRIVLAISISILFVQIYTFLIRKM